MLKAFGSIAAAQRSPSVWLRSLLDVRYLVLLTTAATYALIVLGGTVRATGSGLACPDWPRCHGELVPPLQTQVLIEYSHRLAAVSVGFLILAMAVSVWLWHRDNRYLLGGVAAAILVLIAQVLVGGATVNMELPATVVAVHLALALVLLAALIFAAAAAFRPRPEARPVGTGAGERPRRVLPVAVAAAAAATFALVLTGSYVANSDAGLVYPDWPLFDGSLAPAGGRLAGLHYAHRLMAAVSGLFVLSAAALAWKDRRKERSGPPPGLGHIVRAATGVAVVLYVAQVFVGASNIWLELATPVRVAHLALASALWASLVLAASWGYLEGRRGHDAG